MRLGKIKNILDKAISDDAEIVLKHENLYGGQATLVNNFREIAAIYEIIKDLQWNDADASQLQPIVEKNREIENPVQLEQAEFTILNTYVTKVNQQLPMFFSILDTMTEPQDEKTINIKLPTEIKKFSELNDVNQRLEKLLKLFNIDGEFEFVGFDVGTEWYEICFVGALSYQYFVSSLKIAKHYFEFRKSYYDSKKAELDYKAALTKPDGFNKKEFAKYRDRRLELMIEDKVNEVVDEIKEANGKTPEELQTQLIKATTGLIAELKEGTEFHLSLNPPRYANESNGRLSIDYKKIREIRAAETEKLGKGKVKELENPQAEIEKAQDNESKDAK